MKEEWRPVKDYEGLYEVSNRGNVKSLNYRHTGKERIMKPQKDSGGYLYVHLWKDRKDKSYKIHRLVAQAFIPNPEGYNEVNHKDEDKTNNCVENLEYCSRSYNLTYNDRAKKVAEKNSKPIFGIDRVTGLIVEFGSAKEAERETGISNQSICHCLKGSCKTAGGFYWYYSNDDTE